jgi:Carboxypeptidase regulatory-like domain/TonB dependent receptor/TonB-dependent Receptor Plug Domain
MEISIGTWEETTMKAYATKALVLICVIGLCFSVPLHAQVAGATLTGTITDAQGGAVVGAKVSARNGATGVVTDTTTNASGAYSIVNLIPADYEVSVTATGFSTTTTKLTLTVGAKQELSLALRVGEITQTVEITGAAPIIETTNATLAGNIQSQQIVELPLNGRDWAQLATLEPGVASVRPHEAVDAPGGSTRGLGVQMTVNGARPQQNVYRLNGVIVNDYSNAGPGNVLGGNLGVDAVQEFTVLTSNYSAEYGFTSGGVINAITKSGTNSLHGSVYEFVRNKSFDAADFFDDQAGRPKAPFVRNQFGGSAGWKVLKDRAFLFGDYEGLRQVKSIAQQAKTMTAAMRKGIINDGSGNAPGTVPTNPVFPVGSPCVYTNASNPAIDGMLMPNATNFAPGQASICVDNTIAKLIGSGGSGFGLVPLPNGALIGPDNNIGKYNTDRSERVSDNYGTARGDLRISDKDSLSGSWFRDASSWLRPDLLDQAVSGFEVPHNAYTMEENHIFSASTVNTFRMGYSRSDLLSPAVSTSNALAKDTTLGMLDGCVAPGVTVGGNGLSANSATVTGFGGFTGASGFYARTGRLQVFDDVSHSIGKHTLKLGFMFLDNHDNWGTGSGCGGSASFKSEQDFLQNIPAKVRMPTTVPSGQTPYVPPPTTHHYRSKVFAGYVQDDWKMLTNLTVNVGLRYEMQTIPTETQDKINQLMNPWQNPGTNCKADLNGVGLCDGFYHQIFQRNPTLRNFEPRIGFAWDPFHNGKTSVRGGFGIFDVLPLSTTFALNSLQTAPNGAEIDLSCVAIPTPAKPCGPGTYPKGFDALARSGAGGGNSLRWGYNEQTPKRDYVMQYNLNIQRQITPSTSVSLAYIGSRGLHNPHQMDDINTVFPYKTSAGWLFPNPVGSGCLPGPPNCEATDVQLGLSTVGCHATLSCFSDNPTGIVPGLLINPQTTSAQIQSSIFQAQSWYNALQVKVDKRMSHGFQVGGSYTWGKSFDTSSSSFAGDNYSNNISPIIPWWDQAVIKGLSDFNVTSNLVVNTLWQIPTPASFNGAAGWIARGWGVGGVLELSTGTPLWTLDGVDGDPMGQYDGAPFAIPDVVSGCNLTNPSSGRHGILQYINPDCFTNALAPSAAFFSAAQPQGCDASFISTYHTLYPAEAPLNPLTCINLLGHDPRNNVIGPGLFNVDFSVVKDNHIKRFGEAFNLQFRAEMFNVLNRPNFAPPPTGNLEPIDSTGHKVGGFGQLTTLQVPMREIQFALKLVF